MPGRRAVVAVLALMLVPGLARAEDRAAAQQLFQQGKDLIRAGDIQHACPKFEAAAQLSATAGVRLNLADCWRRLGRTASAWSKFDEALGIAERSGDTVAAEVARKGRAELEPQLAYLTVVVGSDAAIPGLEVTRDGETMPAAAWGTPIPVDPGAHHISARAPGRETWFAKETVDGTGGKKVSVVVPVLVVPEAAPGGPPLAPDRAASPSGGTMRVVGWVSAGAGAIGLGLGTYFTVQALSERSAYHQHLTPSGQCADATCQTDSHSAYASGNAATGSFIVGGLLAATGVVLLVIAGPTGHGTTALAPMVSPDTAGLTAVGKW